MSSEEDNHKKEAGRMRGNKLNPTELKVLKAAIATLHEVRKEHGDEIANWIEKVFSEKLEEKEKKPASSKK